MSARQDNHTIFIDQGFDGKTVAIIDWQREETHVDPPGT